MNNNTIKQNIKVHFFNLCKNVEANILNLPDEIKVSKQFCLWKYQYIENNCKPSKVPYGYLKKQHRVMPSLKDKRHWFTFSEYLNFKNCFNDFNLGLVLTNGSFTVIDIDNYQAHKVLDSILFNMLSKGAYIEVSPSGLGLHIFFVGQWSYSRKKSIVSIGYRSKKTTCEAYCGKDVRFITLTGQSIVLKNQKNNKSLATSSELSQEIEKLAELFFGYDVFGDMYSTPNTIDKNLIQPSLDIDVVNKEYIRIKGEISTSIWKKLYIDLCNCLKSNYNSASEADWAFLQIVARFIDYESQYKKNILKLFFQKDRPYRLKKNRIDYLDRTITKVLSNPVKPKDQIFCTTFSSKNANYKEESQSNLDKKKSKTIKSCSILKICNIMQIFHLGRSYENFKQIEIKNQDNSLEATCPESLTSTDFKYFMQLLFQYKDSKISSKSDYYQINIKKLGEELGLGINGRNYKLFFNSLSKLSKVHLKYNKLINFDKKLYCTSEESLLSYRASYEKHSGKDSRPYKRLEVRMHSAISEILSIAEYNYSLINRESYDQLFSEKLQLLYVYFCQKTLPGKNFTTFTLEDLLDLWPASNNRHTIYTRTEQLISLIENLSSKQAQLKDLDIQLFYENKKLTKVKVKKNRLIPTLNDK